MTVVVCNNVTKSFGNSHALQNFSCVFAENTITGLIGRNGAGKTTLLRTIAGFTRPTAGQITVFDQAPYDNLNVSAQTIVVDDRLAFSTYANMAKILKQCALFYPNWDQPLAEKLLAYFNLSPKQFPKQLSKGMASTFRSIIGICSRSPLTLMDEPTSGMDASVRQDFYRMLLKDYLAHPRTIILSSHLVSEIEELIEDIVLIHQGTHILSAPVLDIQAYALTLVGYKEKLQPYLAQQTILHQESILENTLKVVVSNNYSPAQQQQMKADGIDFAPVSANDLCIYLTQEKDKGGIDRVFS